MDEDVNTNTAEGFEAGAESSTAQDNKTVANNSSEGDEIEAILDEAFSEAAEEPEETKEEQEVEAPAETGEDSEESDKETEEENQKSRGEKRLDDLNQKIRDGVAELNRLKTEISQYKELQLPTVEELTNYIMSQDEDISEADAAIEARMRLVEAQNSRTAEINTIAETRYEQTLAAENARLAYPELFDSKNPNFNRELASGIMQMYEEVAQVKRGDDGEVISATVRLQPFLESIGEIYRLGVTRGEQTGEARKSRSKSKQVNMSYNPYPRNNQAPKGEMTEDDFVRSCLKD